MNARMALIRLVQGVITAFLVFTVVFFIMRLSGDPTMLFLPPEATQEDMDRFRHEMGWDRPLVVQYVRYLGDVVRGDFGDSLTYGGSALEIVLERLPATLELTALAFILTMIIAIPAGLIAAVKPNAILSQMVMILALVGQAMPGFWLGVMMILLFSVALGVLPTGGRGGVANLVMPAVVLGSWGAAKITRLTRAGMFEVLGDDYIRTARGKGVPERVVLFGHALKNALLPVLSALGLTVGAMLGGAIITETVFAWPGVGRLIVQSVLKRDFPVVQVATILLSAIFVVSNLTVDVLYTVVDPRIRYD
ncbi:MAG: ABC transporter permease [Anaerolineales bacterium]|nr:MAG: ABC transporter permease [Anaerolineales bacterium]